jgi:hypothetical protein
MKLHQILAPLRKNPYGIGRKEHGDSSPASSVLPRRAKDLGDKTTLNKVGEYRGYETM